MIDEYDKLELTLNSTLLAIIVIITAVFFWPTAENKKQSNEIDETKTQIKVIVKRVNIRETPNIGSEDIGDVYDGEIFTVLEAIDTKEYYWYKIKTKQGIEGYIASDPAGEYVEIISGYIDRTPPELIIDKEYLTFENGIINYDNVSCNDEYSKCVITHECTDLMNITFTATDERGNKTIRTIKYYNIYNSKDNFKEDKKYVETNYKRHDSIDKTTIYATYKLKKDISSEHKSINYSPMINFYDENFNEVKDIMVRYNEEPLNINCINDDYFELKDEYKEIDLTANSYLCINYSFEPNEKIKYFTLGFSGVENYNVDENILANYFSNYYIYKK